MKIVIGQGSCGVATGAKKTAAEFEKQLAEKNLEAVVDITGCVGTCYLEPIVDVYDDNGEMTRYVKVQPEEVYIRSEENGEISLDTMAVACYKFFKKCIKSLDKAAEAIRKVCFNNDADTEDESPEGTEEQTTGGKKES